MSYHTHQKFSLPLNRTEVAEDWGRRGYTCDLFVDPPGREWNDFVHATNELVTVLDGTLKLTIQDEELIALPGDEIFIPKGVSHSVKNIADIATCWLYGYDGGSLQS